MACSSSSLPLPIVQKRCTLRPDLCSSFRLRAGNQLRPQLLYFLAGRTELTFHTSGSLVPPRKGTQLRPQMLDLLPGGSELSVHCSSLALVILLPRIWFDSIFYLRQLPGRQV